MTALKLPPQRHEHIMLNREWHRISYILSPMTSRVSALLRTLPPAILQPSRIMRLLHYNGDGHFSLTEFFKSAIPEYAILSHTWEADEVTFEDLQNGTGTKKAGYEKIRFCGELIAPTSIEFFGQEFKQIGNKSSLEQQIHEITGIPKSALQGASLSQFSDKERFSWIQPRQIKVEEDKAYSLVGIFDVQMPLRYGEGMANACILAISITGKLLVHGNESFMGSSGGEQRSTYWLSLPWTYALPLAVASSVIHRLISQSIFIARTEILDTYGEPEPLSYMDVGYNPLAILLSLLFGVLMVLAMILNGFRKLTDGSVLVGNNSLAISAAC
ncbi:hypothetical protein BKA61DRAFT_723562 [Leptodontidium sp. MPI-SDFR-AT-0119]|nr:hypothetical protein BKA61DRAFT_723562 [Leptodontidium sp. MPI-SDFR-AT-0119]